MSQIYNFSGQDKIIYLMNTSSFSVLDLYSRWKDWVLDSDNSKYPQAFRYVGGEPTTPGNYLGITYFLTNNWKIQPTGSDHTLTVGGNIYSDDPNSPNIFNTAIGNHTVTIRNSISNISEVKIVGDGSDTLLNEISNKISELWKLHGLDISNPLTVTTSSRTTDTINQIISGSQNYTTVTRI